MLSEDESFTTIHKKGNFISRRERLDDNFAILSASFLTGVTITNFKLFKFFLPQIDQVSLRKNSRLENDVVMADILSSHYAYYPRYLYGQ